MKTELDLPRHVTWIQIIAAVAFLGSIYGYALHLENKVEDVEKAHTKTAIQVEETTKALNRIEKSLCKICVRSETDCPVCNN